MLTVHPSRTYRTVKGRGMVRVWWSLTRAVQHVAIANNTTACTYLLVFTPLLGGCLEGYTELVLSSNKDCDT